MSICWKDMSDRDERYYELVMEERDREALLKYLSEPGLSFSTVAITAAAAAALLLGRKKIRK